MHHLAKVTFGKFENKPYHGECACGTAGDFGSNQEAREYLMMHLTRLQGVNSADFADETVEPLPVPPPEEPAKEEPKPAEEPKPEEPQPQQEQAQAAAG